MTSPSKWSPTPGLAAWAVGAHVLIATFSFAGRLRTAPEAGQRVLRLTLGLDALLFLIALAAIAAATSLTGPPSP